MDNSALIRIKFSPLLRKVSNGSVESKCFIEIMPELSNVQNLDNIDWIPNNDHVEYEIPMTYKVTIKKVQNDHLYKVYHSCVDLLPSYSVSNMNLASGDVKRIRSDDMFILNMNSCGEKYDPMPTKNLLTGVKNPGIGRNTIKKSVSVQTVQVEQLKQLPQGVDKCFQADLYEKPVIIRVTHSNETLKAILDKYDVETMTSDLTIKKKDKNITIPNSGHSVVDYIENFNRKNSQRKLSLSPICSVNTCDAFSPGPNYITKDASSYGFCNSNTNRKEDVRRLEYIPCKVDLNEHVNEEKRDDVKYIASKNNFDEFDNDNERNLITLKNDLHDSRHKDEIDTYVHIKEPMSICQSLHTYDITTSVSQITLTLIEMKNKYINNNESRSNVKRKSTHKSLGVINNTNHAGYEYNEPSNMIFAVEKYNDTKNNTTHTKKCETDTHNKQCLVKSTPAVRVARLMQKFEAEMYPLQQMLHAIKSKCVSLGLDLFCGEFTTSAQKNIIYKPVSSIDYSVEKSNEHQQTKHDKSNRVVYTVLFNG